MQSWLHRKKQTKLSFKLLTKWIMAGWAPRAATSWMWTSQTVTSELNDQKAFQDINLYGFISESKMWQQSFNRLSRKERQWPSRSLKKRHVWPKKLRKNSSELSGDCEIFDEFRIKHSKTLMNGAWLSWIHFSAYKTGIRLRNAISQVHVQREASWHITTKLQEIIPSRAFGGFSHRARLD